MRIAPSKHLVTIKLDTENNIIYHSLFGGAIRVKKDVVRLIQRFRGGLDCRSAFSKNELSAYKDTLSELRKRHFLVKEGSDERALFNRYDVKKRERKLAAGKYISTIKLEMVNYCNFRCRHCFTEKLFNRKKNKKMSFSTAKRAIDGFFNILKKANTKLAAISLWGGEPLLNWKVIQQIIEYVDRESKRSSVKIWWGLSTNGSLLSDSILRTLKQHGFHVVVSLDGVGRDNDRFRQFANGSGTFESITKGIGALARYGIDYSVELVLNDYNFHSVEKVIDLVHDTYRCDNIVIGPIFFQERTLAFDRHNVREKAKRFVELYDYAVKKGMVVGGDGVSMAKRAALKRNRSLIHCRGIGSCLYIKTSGLVSPCHIVTAGIGNVREIEKIPRGRNYQYMAMRSVDKIDSCRGCEIEGFCAGGCAGIAEFYSGKIYDTSHHHFRTFYCNFFRNVFIELLKYYVRQ